jgi:hypothetical protein
MSFLRFSRTGGVIANPILGELCVDMVWETKQMCWDVATFVWKFFSGVQISVLNVKVNHIPVW